MFIYILISYSTALRSCYSHIIDSYFYSVYPWRPYSQDLWLLLESKWTVGDLLSVWGQHHASLADGEAFKPISFNWV